MEFVRCHVSRIFRQWTLVRIMRNRDRMAHRRAAAHHGTSQHLRNSEVNHSFRLRIFDNAKGDGVKVRKLGIRELRCCDRGNRWFPPRGHHPFLSLAMWPSTCIAASFIDQYSDAGANGEGRALTSYASGQHFNVHRHNH